MSAVLLIEQDTLIRELMREHLEREGYVVCAVGSVRGGVNAGRWTRFGLVMLDFESARASEPALLGELRALGAPVVMMRSGPSSSVDSPEGAVEHVSWSPFDLSTLTNAVRRFLAPVAQPKAEPESGPPLSRSGTYAVGAGATGAARTNDRRDLAEVTTLPAPPDGVDAGETTLEALGALVLAATGRRN